MRVDVEIRNELEDKLLEYMKKNGIKTRSEGVRVILESYFDSSRLINQKILSLVTEIHNEIIIKKND